MPHTHECSQCHKEKPCPFSGECPLEAGQKPQCKDCVAAWVAKNCGKPAEGR